MKRFFILIFSFLICGALIGGLWYVLLLRGEPEVRKIYKVPHLEQKSVKQQQIERSETSDAVSASNKIESSDEATRDDIRSSLLAEEGFSPEEEAAFWEWLANQYYEDNSTKSVSDQHQEAVGLSAGYSSGELSYVELSELVGNAYNLEMVLELYGIKFNLDRRRAICPFCSSPTLSTTVDGSTGHRDFWRCSSCVVGPKDFIDFVAGMESISNRYHALKYLAEQAGLLE